MKFDESQRWLERARRVIPGGVNSSVRALSEPIPLFYSRAEGSRIWDIDGNEYIDYVLGQGPMLLGHTPRAVIDAMKRQCDLGLIYAGQTDHEVRAAELMRANIPCAEMVRFSTTGSEAVHAALRLARAATGRKMILRFEGHYHGWLDNIAWNQAKPGADLGPREDPPMRPSSGGQQLEDAANLFVRSWNDLALVESLFQARGPEIAGVICDPFACAAGLIPAQPDFLQGLRELCDRYGALLIFDEVITGFRVHPGGAQALYGITPDLATFAKAMGGGMPVSAIAGKEKYMRLFGDMTAVHSGTYNSNPPAMAATVAALELIFDPTGAELAKARTAGEALMTGIKNLAAHAGLPLEIRGVPTVFSTSFVPIGAQPVVDYRTARQADAALGRRFWAALHKRGVQITSFGIWFVSTAHTNDDVRQTLDVVKAVCSELC